MCEKFEKCVEIVFGKEGGWSDHSADRGGKTNFGITWKTYRNYERSKGRWISNKQAKEEIRYLQRDYAKEIYKIGYWNKCKCDRFHISLALIIFDLSVNSGPRTAGRMLQRIVRSKADGIIGQKTIEATNEYILTAGGYNNMQRGIQCLINALIKRRKRLYRIIVERDASQAIFSLGWRNRLNSIRDKATQLNQ